MAKTEEAYDRLKADLLRSRIAPGASLVVAGLKARYGLGWTPLREALSRLEAERLVVLMPNRGYRVCGVSAESLRDLQDARLAIEPRLFIRSIAEGGEEWEGRVVAAHHQLASTPVPVPHAARDAIHLWERRHDAFHAALLSGTQAPWLQLFASQVNDQLRRHQRHMLSSPEVRARMDDDPHGRLRETYEKTLGLGPHTELMQAALDRDADRASRLLTDHIGFSLAVFEALWS